MADSLSVTVETDGDADELELPADLVDLFREDPSETDAQIVGDMVVMAFSERAHAIAHHGEGGDEAAIQEMETAMMDLFEERFGMTYGEATGHSH